MVRSKSGREKVSFTATKKVAVPRKVSFRTKAGKKVSFTRTERVSKLVKVNFYRRVKRSK